MTGPCPNCRYDPGFDAIVCPKCGADLAQDGAAAQRSASRSAGTDAPTVAETSQAPGERLRTEVDHTVMADEATLARSRTVGRGCFFVVAGPDRGRQFQIDTQGMLGRAGRADVGLSDPRVSDRHALIKWLDGHFVFQDLQATNGSFLLVGGRRERLRGPHILRDNDELLVGHSVLRFIALDGGGKR